MPRPLRLEFPGVLYHLMARGNAQQDIFLDAMDRDAFLAEASRKPKGADANGTDVAVRHLMRSHTVETCEGLSFFDFDIERNIVKNTHQKKISQTISLQSSKRMAFMSLVLQPSSLMAQHLQVERQAHLILFKLTDAAQERLEDLLDRRKNLGLTSDEQTDLDVLAELDRIFTYINSQLALTH